MKRIFAMLLCVCVCLVVLFGCGQAKEAPLCYPHNDALQIDASAGEILQSENMVLVYDFGTAKQYEAAKPVDVAGLECLFGFYVLEGSDKPDAYYRIDSNQSDLNEEFLIWKDYISKTYGEPTDVDLSDSAGDGYIRAIQDSCGWFRPNDISLGRSFSLTREKTTRALTGVEYSVLLLPIDISRGDGDSK